MVIQPQNTRRLFLGFSFPGEFNKPFNEILYRLKDRGVQNLTKVENLHITLAFIGNVPIDEVQKIQNAIRSFDFKMYQPQFSFKDLAIKINNKKVMLWGRFKPNDEALKLHKEIHRVLGIKPDHKFSPHITFCRARKDQTILNKNQFQGIELKNLIPKQAILFKTSISKLGLKYIPLNKSPFE